MSQVVFKQCKKCGALVEVIEDCKCESCGMMCCGQPMEVLVPNSSDGVRSAHIPKLRILGQMVIISINHTMTDEHHIEWVACAHDRIVNRKIMPQGIKCNVSFNYKEGSTIYVYCNKHGLWALDVDAVFPPKPKEKHVEPPPKVNPYKGKSLELELKTTDKYLVKASKGKLVPKTEKEIKELAKEIKFKHTPLI